MKREVVVAVLAPLLAAVAFAGTMAQVKWDQNLSVSQVLGQAGIKVQSLPSSYKVIAQAQTGQDSAPVETKLVQALPGGKTATMGQLRAVVTSCSVNLMSSLLQTYMQKEHHIDRFEHTESLDTEQIGDQSGVSGIFPVSTAKYLYRICGDCSDSNTPEYGNLAPQIVMNTKGVSVRLRYFDPERGDSDNTVFASNQHPFPFIGYKTAVAPATSYDSGSGAAIPVSGDEWIASGVGVYADAQYPAAASYDLTNSQTGVAAGDYPVNETSYVQCLQEGLSKL